MGFRNLTARWGWLAVSYSVFMGEASAQNESVPSDTGAETRNEDASTDTNINTDTDSEPLATDTDAAPAPEVEQADANETDENMTAADAAQAQEPEELSQNSGIQDGEADMLGMDLEALLETPIEVWSATKTRQSVNEAPAIITVVTKEEIRRHGYASVAEILHHTLGFYVVDDHMLPNLGIRGVAGGFMGESGTVKVMIDGQSVEFRSTGGNWLGPELIPLSAVERIEIIRGPASALYGADAFLGVVDVITRKGADLKWGSIQGAGTVNAYGKPGYDTDTTLGTRYKNFEIMLSGRVNGADLTGLPLPDSSPSPSIPAYNADLTKTEHLQQASRVVHGVMTYYIAKKHRLSLTGHFSQIERTGEFSPWSQLSYGLDDEGHSRGTVISMMQANAALEFDSDINDKFSLRFKTAYLTGRPTDDDRIDTGNDLYSIKRDFGYKAVECSLEGNWKIIESLTAVLGAEFLYDWENLPSSLHVLRTATDTTDAGEIEESSSIRQGDTELYNMGAFAQLMWSALKPYLDLVGGFRYDYHSIYGNQFSGRAGAISNPQKMLFLKLLYGSAFKAPSPLLLYGVPYEVGDIVGNPDLKPQKVHTVEGQVILKPKSFLSLSTGVAYNLLIDKAEFVQQGINRVASNVSKMKSLSWESEIVGEYKEWLRGNISFELQKTTRDFEDPSSVYLSYLVGNKNVIYPSFIFRADLSGRIPKVPIRLGIGIMTVGERPASEMNALENLEMYSLPIYTLLSAHIATVGLELMDGKETTLSLIGKNLTNQKVADPGFAGIDYPLLPLTVFLSLRQEL